jgi:hypothetical protein
MKFLRVFVFCKCPSVEDFRRKPSKSKNYSQLIYYSRKAMMAHGVETRVPF